MDFKFFEIKKDSLCNYKNNKGVMSETMRNKGIDLIKLLAIITMVVDHIRYLLPEYQLPCIAIGRWAFIMFSCAMAFNALQIFENEKYDSLKKYFKNLVIFAIISEIPYQLASQGHNLGTMNIMVTLFFGLLSISVVNTKLNPVVKYVLLGFVLGFCLFINDKLEFGFLGVILTFAFYLMFKYYRTGLRFLLIPVVISLAIMCNVQYYLDIIDKLGLGSIWVYSMIVGCLTGVIASLLLSLGKIDLSRYKINKVGKWAWWFYPVHLLVIGVLVKIL